MRPQPLGSRHDGKPMSDGAAIELLVLDDHALVREGVMLLLRQRPWIARCRGAA